MKTKFWRLLRFFYVVIFILSLFTLIRLNVKCYYAMQMANNDYTLAMALLDKAHIFQLTSYVNGWLHCAVVGVMLRIILDR